MRVATLLVLAVAASAAASDADWWQTALIYQIYPRSFKDSDGDGIGDLNGITEKLPYLQQLGVDAIWLSPIYLSPMYDFGYDITNYTKIAPEYGTMEDFDNLMAKAKALGIRVVLDYVPNHTGNESEWFIKSAQREAGYENYYIWADGTPDPNDASTTLPPNNWVSNFRKSAWEYSTTRGQYYLHQFAIGQPDLNYREAKVQEEMKNVLRFWLDKGVSGFRVDAINMMYEVDPNDYGGVYPDEPLSGDEDAAADDYNYLSHIYTRDLNETYNVVYDWRDLLDEYYMTDGEYKIMMTEAYTELTLMIRYYGTDTRNGSIPFNFSFLENIKNNSNARDMKLVIDKWMTYMPNGKTANWVNGNHDQSRVASRQGSDRVDAMNLLALLLPGVALTYQGEEIGMLDGEVTWEQTVDPQACNTDDPINYWKKSRDPNRTPYQWDSSAHAGFSTTTGDTWLPVASNYRTLNLAAQMAAEKSHYKFYKDVLAVRKLPAVRAGDLETTVISESVLVVSRLLPGYPGVVGIVNLSDEEYHLDLTSIKLLPVQMRVVASGVDCPHKKDEWMRKSNITVTAHCALLLQTVRKCC
ncbi:maltase A1-like isoform X1 [Plodia interpunctella]|uniref:maltase A1-like isoform X1 n=1 Tax=Plodia interpunctella TaxID=58824 RepID=UPI002368E207|nr:maltase A1-like isoform X1 [Plodia interpunctella]XP_053603081.1 maltase A1-like isoform X1 [Plodia interpunctella]XP_053603082.1 maltase A1-like isoform X1 [Plodia interpunctella]XP_053603083.1 maltase A1-like isoform X1 [Plodia interpunctella]